METDEEFGGGDNHRRALGDAMHDAMSMQGLFDVLLFCIMCTSQWNQHHEEKIGAGPG